MKNNQDSQIHSITFCNTGMYFSKKKHVQCGLGLAPEAGEFLRIFVLQPVRLHLTVSSRKKIGEQDVLVAPQ